MGAITSTPTTLGLTQNLVIAIYFTQESKDASPRNDVIAAASDLIIKTLAT